MSKATDAPAGNSRPLPIPTEEGRGLVRKPIYLLNQQLGDPGRAIALGLLPGDVSGYELIDDPSGLRISYPAQRLLDGILKIYEGTGREKGTGAPLGHFPTTQYHKKKTPQGEDLVAVTIPGLYVTERELLEAYGVKEKPGGRYSQSARDRVKAAIWELGTAKQTIYYIRKEGRGKRAKESTIRITGPLFTVAQVEYLDGPGAFREAVDPRATWYQIIPNSLLLDGISSFHIRSSASKYLEIDDELAKIRGSRAGRKGSYHALLIDYLQSLNTPEHKIDLKRLATKLRLGYMAQNRRYSDMRRAVEEAGEVAHSLGYLLEPMIIAGPDRAPLCYFKLNPAKCTRVKTRKAAAADEPKT